MTDLIGKRRVFRTTGRSNRQIILLVQPMPTSPTGCKSCHASAGHYEVRIDGQLLRAGLTRRETEIFFGGFLAGMTQLFPPSTPIWDMGRNI